MQEHSASRRSEGRFYINGKATRVTVTVAGDGQAKTQYHGHLADLSLRGVKIAVDGRVPVGAEVELQIEVTTMSFRVLRHAIVRWQQPRDATSWWTGCEIPEPFDREMIEGLAAAHVLNRRRDPRYDVDCPARVRWELSDQLIDARLINFSKGGFCIRLEEPADFPSDRLMLVIPSATGDVTVPARMMWHKIVPDGYGIGCSYTTMDGFLRVRDYAEPASTSGKQLSRSRMSAWVAIALLVLATVTGAQMLTRDPLLLEKTRSAWQHWFNGEPEEALRDAAQTVPTSAPHDEPLLPDLTGEVLPPL